MNWPPEVAAAIAHGACTYIEARDSLDCGELLDLLEAAIVNNANRKHWEAKVIQEAKAGRGIM